MFDFIKKVIKKSKKVAVNFDGSENSDRFSESFSDKQIEEDRRSMLFNEEKSKRFVSGVESKTKRTNKNYRNKNKSNQKNNDARKNNSSRLERLDRKNTAKNGNVARGEKIVRETREVKKSDSDFEKGKGSFKANRQQRKPLSTFDKKTRLKNTNGKQRRTATAKGFRKTREDNKASFYDKPSVFPSDQDLQKKNGKQLGLTPSNIKKEEVIGKPFSELGLSNKKLFSAMEKANFETAMPVQEKVIPLALSGVNLAVSSPTGSGKTLAFALPALQRYYDKRQGMTLVLSPTREIAIQTKNVFDKLLCDEESEAGLVIGGVNMGLQEAILRKYPPFLIATPGRLVDMIKRGLVWLSYVDSFILDEMDRMFDMGFQEDIEIIFREVAGLSADKKNYEKLDKKLQIMMFTATFTSSIEKVVKRYVSKYETLIIERKMKISENINHFMVRVKNANRFNLMKKIFAAYPNEKMIVFFNTILDTLSHTKMLRKAGMRDVVALHSKKTQDERVKALEEFRTGKKRILLATDVAARGIDIPMVGIVVNYAIPRNNEEYIHRIGRTGRANSLGSAITFVHPDDNRELKKLEKSVKAKFRFQTEADLVQSSGKNTTRKHS